MLLTRRALWSCGRRAWLHSSAPSSQRPQAKPVEEPGPEEAGPSTSAQPPEAPFPSAPPPSSESAVAGENPWEPEKVSFSRPALHRRPYTPFAPVTEAQLAEEAVDAQAYTPPRQQMSVQEEESGLSWQPRRWEWSELGGLYASLVKARLTGLVVASGVAGFAMAPVSFALAPLAATTLGTAALSASANSLNQFLEVPYDSQMQRTLGRPLVRGKLTPLHALTVAGVCGAGGFVCLYQLANPLTAWLGLANLALYAGVYTPMKRLSVGCTWAGAVVGALPPLMGWAGALGPDASLLQLGPAALTLAGILYAWQFPHFNSLSWNLRGDYSRAGYRVMCVTRPELCLRTSLRYSAALVGLCSLAAPLTGLTTWLFAADSLLFNLPLLALSYRFYKAPDSKNSRQLFRFTLAYLPAVMLLMFISKPPLAKPASEQAASQPSKDLPAQSALSSKAILSS